MVVNDDQRTRWFYSKPALDQWEGSLLKKSISGGFLHNALQWLEIQFKVSLIIIFWVFLWRRVGLLSNDSLPGWKFTYFTEIALASKHIARLSSNFILSTSWVALYSVVCLWVRCQASVTPDPQAVGQHEGHQADLQRPIHHPGKLYLFKIHYQIITTGS